MVTGLNRERNNKVCRGKRFEIEFIKRTVLVDRVHDGPGQYEKRQGVADEFQLKRLPKDPALGRRCRLEHRGLRRGSCHGCPAAIRNPYHQRRNAIMRGDYGMIREQDVRPWPGKADKDQARNDGGENEPAKDLERGKEMRIEIGRRHGSVANSRKGLK